MHAHGHPSSPGPIDPAPWSRVLAVMEHLALTRDLNDVLALINDSMRDTLGAERASVLCYDQDHDELVAAHAHGIDTPLRFSAHAGIAGQAAQTRQIINVPDCYVDPRFNPDVDRRTGFRTRAMLTVPLVSHDGKLEGVAQVLNKANGGAFTPHDEQIARALASQAAVAIRRAVLLESERRRLKMESDLRAAREIQSATLPRELPTLDGYSLAAWLDPADQTAGDSYDVIHSADRLYLLVADAAGHGVGPALAVAQVQAMFRLAVHARIGFEALVRHLSTAISDRLPVGMYVCAFLAELDPSSGSLNYVAAGVSPSIHFVAPRDAASCHHADLFSATLPPLGVEPLIDPDAFATLRLNPGDALLIATDGVFEQPSSSGSRLHDQEIADRLAAASRQVVPNTTPAATLIRSVIDLCEAQRSGNPPQDDRTALVIARG